MESLAQGHSCSRSWSTFIPKLQLHFLRPTKALFYTYLQPFLIAKYIVLFCNPKGFGNCKIVSLGSTKKIRPWTAKAGCNCIRNYQDRIILFRKGLKIIWCYLESWETGYRSRGKFNENAAQGLIFLNILQRNDFCSISIPFLDTSN